MKGFGFLDMDGVLTDFVTGVSQAHNRPSPYEDPKSYGIWDMEILWGISVEEFWRPTQFEGFWLNLGKMPEADAIVDLVCSQFGTENVCVLTSPSEDMRCIPEKKEWIRRNYPALKSNMLFGSAKRFLAGDTRRVLIDDRDKNVESFVQYGGTGITMPHLFNKEYRNADRSVEFVREKLEAWATSHSN